MADRRERLRRRGLAALCATIAGVAGVAGAATRDDPGFALRSDCPPGFALTATGVCRLHTLYQFYDSLQGRGLGGTRTALPPHRDGFTPRQIDLGRYLFFDPLLSGNGSQSCASCHRPELGWSDGRKRSIGATGADVGRAAPSLWNVAFLKRLFWDARADSLEAQAQGPLFSATEMANTRERLEATLNANGTYRRLFRDAYPDAPPGRIRATQVYHALAAFETSLVSLNSRYDRYAHGHHAALSPREIEGLNVFRSFVARCSECHTPPLFTNEQVAVIGAPEADGRPFDPGAESVLGERKLRGGFKVPSLRNVARTAPYMHSGAFATLRETVEFYNAGRGNAVPAGEALYLHWHIVEPRLSEQELDRLVDFLQALTDESFTPAVPARVPSGLTPIDHPPATLRSAARTLSPSRGVSR
jgi:cytochrome c peroxidase